MARQHSVGDIGYYPTPNVETKIIADLLRGDYSGYSRERREAIMLDPCAGTGRALAQIAEYVRMGAGFDYFPRTFGVEMHGNRIKSAERLLTKAIKGDFFNTDISPGRVKFLLLNPPYDSDPDFGRLEQKFLHAATPLLAYEGVMAFIIPRAALKTSARYIASHFENVSYYTFGEDTYDRFKQIVIMGERTNEDLPNEELESELLSFASRTNLVAPPIRRYPVFFDTDSMDSFIFSMRVADVPGALQAFREKSGEMYQGDRDAIWGSDNSSLTTRPPLEPLMDNHLSLLIASGGVNGLPIWLEDRPVLMHGSAEKVADSTEEEIGDGVIQYTETERIRPVFKELDMTTFEFTKLEEGDLEEYIGKWGQTIQNTFREAYPPQVETDILDIDSMLPTLLREPYRRQRSAIVSTAEGLKANNKIITVGETGSGKTQTALGAAASLNEEGLVHRILVMGPPHLGPKWEREAKLVVPNCRTARPKTVAALDRIIAEERVLDWADKRLRKSPKADWTFTVEDVAADVKMATALVERALEQTGVRASRDAAAKVVNRGPLLVYIGRENAKLGAARQPAFRIHPVIPPSGLREVIARNPEEIPDAEVKEYRYKILLCSECFQPLYRMVKGEREYLRYSDLRKRQTECAECDAPAWAQGPQPAALKKRPIESFADWDRAVTAGRVGELSNQEVFRTEGGILKDGNRFPLAERIKQHSRRRKDFDLLVLDEVHQYKGGDTAQGIAAAMMSEAARYTLALTGTLYDGKSSSLFHILWRFDNALRHEYGLDEMGRFKNDFGFVKRTRRGKEDDEFAGYGGYTSRRKNKGKTSIQEIARLHPDLVRLLLPITVNVRLNDVAAKGTLPPKNEYVIGVDMTDDQSLRYGKIQDDLKDALAEELENGTSRLLGAYLQILLSCSDRCYEWEYLKHPDPEVEELIVNAPGLSPDVVYPKEAALIKVIRNELAHGRRVMVYVTHTNVRDMRPRLVKVLADAGIHAKMLSASIAADKREERIAKMLEDGMQVFITNPKLVETGLDLLDFPSTVFYEMDYSAYVTRQGSGRAFRIGQQHPVHLYYFAYNHTMQERALNLISDKTRASLALEGELPEGGLASASEGGSGDLFIILARMLANGDVNYDGGSGLSIADALAQSNGVLDDYYAAKPELSPAPITVFDTETGESREVLAVPDAQMGARLTEADRAILEDLVRLAAEAADARASRRRKKVEPKESNQPDMFSYLLGTMAAD